MGAQSAHAITIQESCSDVLKDGTFQQSRFRENDYFKQIIYSRFLRSTYATSKSDTAAGFGAPVGELVMGTGNYSESEYDARKDQIQRTFLNVVTESREIDVALMSGDTAVLNAWKECMIRKGGGVSLRFEAASPTDAFAILEFYSAPGTSARLASNIAVPKGTTVTSGGECLKKNTLLTAGSTCAATIVLPNARATWLSAVNVKGGSAFVAYLAPRLTLRSETRAFNFTPNCSSAVLGMSPSATELVRCADRLWTHSYRQSPDHMPSNTVRVPDNLLQDGWLFDPKTAKAELVTIDRYSPSGMSSCRSSKSEPTTLSFTYGYWNHSESHGHDGWSQIYCMMEPSIFLRRDVWADKPA
jgi:hypothetical protein